VAEHLDRQLHPRHELRWSFSKLAGSAIRFVFGYDDSLIQRNETYQTFSAGSEFMKILVSSGMDGAPAVSTPQADIHVENDAYAAPDLAQEEAA
jgi:hypothetical protein